MIHRWLALAEHGNEFRALGEKIDPERIHNETPEHIARLHHLSDRVFGEFIQLFGMKKNRAAKLREAQV
jgi:hypothetical protein